MATTPSVRVAGIRVHPDVCRTGILITSESGGGKTSLVKKLLSDVLALGEPLLTIDTADELTDFIEAKAPRGMHIPISRIDAHCRGGWAIDFAPVLTTETRRQQFSRKLCVEVKGDPQPFFRQMTRIVLQTGMRILHLSKPNEWTLADLIRIATRRYLLSALAKLVPLSGGDPYAELGQTDAARDVAGTVASILQPLAIYAALAERCSQRVSPTALASPGAKGAMILVWRDKAEAALEGVYSFVLDLLAEEKLAHQSNERLWILADELRSLQPLECIPKIARRGRKSAICMVVSMHEISGMRDRYGKDRAEEMLALLKHKVFLRIASPETAKWASEYLGTTEVVEDIPPLDPGNKDTAWKRSVKDRPNVTPTELRRLPVANPVADRIEGYVDFPEVTAPFTCPFMADVRCPAAPIREEVPADWEILRPMAEADLARLNLPNTKAVREALST